MQRVILTQLPMSRLALWSSRIGWFALAATLLSILIIRSGILEVKPALATFTAALICAASAILLALVSFVVIWRQGLRGFGRALNGMFLGVMLLAYPAYLGFLASKLPMITDVTTDPDNPPQFNILTRQHPTETGYSKAMLAALQKSAYPYIAPLQIDVHPNVAYNVVLKLIVRYKWQVVNKQSPERRRDGLIEAVARTSIMGLRHDVIVRVSANGRGTRIDARSASRFGFTDFGANAVRLRNLLHDINDAAASLPESELESEKSPPIPPSRPDVIRRNDRHRR